MDDIHIDASTASIITDRAIPPQGLGAAPYTIKLVLYCLRGLGAPGAFLSVPRGVIEERTQLKETAVKKVIRILLEAGILIQVEKPAPGRVARYQVSYVTLADWLCGADRQVVQLDTVQRNAGATRPRSQAQRAPEHRRDAPPSESTQARSARTGARRAQTPARSAPDYKEVTALPALPAAAALSATQQLANAAAVGVGVMTGEAWETLGKRAGLERDTASIAAHTLVELGIADAERGLRAMEKLAERLKSPNQVKNPTGLLRTIAARPGEPEPTTESVKRDRIASQKRERTREMLHSYEPETLERIARKTRIVVERRTSPEAAEIVPDGRYLANAPDAVVDFMHAHRDEIVAVSLKGVAA